MNDPQLAQTDGATGKGTSTSSMLVTMLLLIAGFILCGTLMLHYAVKQRAAEGGAVAASSFSGAVFSAMRDAQRGTGGASPGDHEPAADASSLVGKLLPPQNGKVRWPRMELAGFGRGADGTGGFAIINGKQILVGEHFGKVALVDVNSQGAVVEYMGERQTLVVDIPLD